jgi:rhodanese-related sulfurtransferase
MKKYILILLVLLWSGSSPLVAATVQVMDKDELKSLLGSSSLVLFDVRTGKDWSSSEFKIKGAVRLESDQVAAAVDNYGKEKTLVFYCA